VLGKLESNIHDKIELPIETAISDLKKYKSELPFNLYNLSSRHVGYLKRMFAIINGMKVPDGKR
jgi:hypothetical protein